LTFDLSRGGGGGRREEGRRNIIEEGRAANKSPKSSLKFGYFLSTVFPSKEFLPIAFQIQLVRNFSPKTEDKSS
jgi:hypothetical protein